MVTVEEKKSRELNTADDIAGYLVDRYDAAQATLGLKPGDVVDITSRAGMTPDMAAGNVGVFVADLPNQPWCYILCLNAAGVEVTVQAQAANLSKRAAS